jgi:hypothetical protein
VIDRSWPMEKIGWIGDVPSHWEVVAIKWLTPVKRGASPRPIDDPIYFDDEGEWAWVRISDVSSAGVSGVLRSTSQTLSELGSSLSVKIVPGELFVSIAATVGKPCITRIKCCIHDGFVYFPDLHIDPWWLFRVFEAGECYRGLGKLGTQLNLNTDTIGGIKVPVPPPDEIQQILAYLDRETARIDTLIEEQQRLIEMLGERRQALIDASFSTLGGPTVQLRRFIKFLTSGSRGWGDYYADQGERFLRIGNLPRANLEIRGDIQFVDLPADVTEGSRTMLQEGDLLFSITAYLGSVAVVQGDWVGAYVSQHVALCRLDHDLVDPRFIGWFMLTTTGQDQLNEGAAGGTKMQLALDDVRGLRVPTAPTKEQSRVAAYLDQQTAKIDALIEETERFIGLARERRSALITAAVTGQIDVWEMA